MKQPKFQIGDLLGIGLTLVVLGIGLAYGLQVMGDIQDNMGEDTCSARTDTFTSYNDTANQCYNSSGTHTSVDASEFNATVDAIEGVAELPEQLPTIATVIVASVIIGILVTYLWGRFAG